MAEDWLTSREAARLLGVTPDRVNALARSGELYFRMAGRTRLIDPASVHRLSATTRRRPGRPLAPVTAWAALLSDLAAAGWPQVTAALGLTAQQRYNLRRRIARTSAGDWDSLAKNRAMVHRVQARPAYLREILNSDGVVRSGVSATATYGLDLVAPEEGEGYTDEETWQRLRREFHLLPSASGNLALRVPAIRSRLVLDREIMPVAVVAVDLLDSGEPRSRRTALRSLQRLLEGLHRDGPAPAPP